MSWSTSELRARLATQNWFKPSSKIFLLTVPRQDFYCGSFVLFMSCICHAFASVHCRLVVTCWERADLLGVVCDVLLCFCHFPVCYPRSGVILDCTDFRFLPHVVLLRKEINQLHYNLVTLKRLQHYDLKNPKKVTLTFLI